MSGTSSGSTSAPTIRARPTGTCTITWGVGEATMARTSASGTRTRGSSTCPRCVTRVRPRSWPTTLSAKVAHFPYVAYKHVHIDRTWLLSVIRHIRARRIKVRVATLRKDELAAYGGDMILLNDSKPARGTNTSLTLVHEATHAILDLQKAAFPRWEHELIAYLAEALCKISGGFRELPDGHPRKGGSIGAPYHRRQGQDGHSSGSTTMSMPPPSRTSRVKSSRPSRRYGTRSFGVMGSDASATTGAAVHPFVARTQGDGT